MATPRHRRRGYSRRAQYGLFVGYVAAVAGAVFAVGLLLIGRLDPATFALMRGTAIDATAPLTGVGRVVVRGFEDMGSSISAYLDAGNQNRALRAALDGERRRAIATKALVSENARLKRLALVVEHLPKPVVSARLIGSSITAHRRFATLAAGHVDGVLPGQPVRSAEGLVGRVYETGQFAARVLLLTDGESAVPVRVVRTNQPALASGRGDGMIDLRGLTTGGRPFRRGDLVVTSGTGGVYAPNIPVAVVTRLTGDRALARPLADPASLDFALVYPIFQAPLDAPPSQPKP